MRNLTASDRRREIRATLAARGNPVTGSELAMMLGVSRQIIVQDVALLRASGAPILATPQGYLIPAAGDGARLYRAVFACRHDLPGTAPELQAMVDHGLRVVDVIVEHQIYGELRGLLMIESRADVQDFVEKAEGGAALLSTLTQGVHLHTVEATRADQIERAREALRMAGLLVGDE